MKQGAKTLRERFDHAIPPTTLHLKLQTCIAKTKYAKQNNIISTEQFNRLYPQYRPPKSENFDVSLLYYLLRNICGLDGKSKWWKESDNNKIPDTDHSEEADIQRIKNMRNMIQHIDIASLEEVEFEAYWDTMEKAMCRLAAKCNLTEMKDEIDDLKSAKLLSDQFRNLRANSKIFLKEFKNEQQFVETLEYDKAQKVLNDKKIVILTGYPGEGKSTMAARLALESSRPDKCLKLASPADWRQIDLKLKLIDTIIIDDIFGEGVMDPKLVSDWRIHLPELERAAKYYSLRIIITSRHFMRRGSPVLGNLPMFQHENESALLLSSGDVTDEEKSRILNIKSMKVDKMIPERLFREFLAAARGSRNEWQALVDAKIAAIGRRSTAVRIIYRTTDTDFDDDLLDDNNFIDDNADDPDDLDIRDDYDVEDQTENYTTNEECENDFYENEQDIYQNDGDDIEQKMSLNVDLNVETEAIEVDYDIGPYDDNDDQTLECNEEVNVIDDKGVNIEITNEEDNLDGVNDWAADNDDNYQYECDDDINDWIAEYEDNERYQCDDDINDWIADYDDNYRYECDEDINVWIAYYDDNDRYECDDDINDWAADYNDNDRYDCDDDINDWKADFDENDRFECDYDINDWAADYDDNDRYECDDDINDWAADNDDYDRYECDDYLNDWAADYDDNDRNECDDDINDWAADNDDYDRDECDDDKNDWTADNDDYDRDESEDDINNWIANYDDNDRYECDDDINDWAADYIDNDRYECDDDINDWAADYIDNDRYECDDNINDWGADNDDYDRYDDIYDCIDDLNDWSSGDEYD